MTKIQKFAFSSDLSLLDRIELELSEMRRGLDRISLDILLRKATDLTSNDIDLYDLRAPLGLALWSYLNPGEHLTLKEISSAFGVPSKLNRSFRRHLDEHVSGCFERILLKPPPFNRGRPPEGTHEHKKPGRWPYGYRWENPFEDYARTISGQEKLLPLIALLSKRSCLRDLDLIDKFFASKRAPEYLMWSFNQISQVLAGLVPLMPYVWKDRFKDTSARLGFLSLPDRLPYNMTSLRRKLTDFRLKLLSMSNEEILDALTPDLSKYCSKCNVTLPVEAKSCPVCGTMQETDNMNHFLALLPYDPTIYIRTV